MFSEDPILLPEIVDQIVLVTVHPASEREDEELQRRRHSLRLLGRLDQHRPSLGRFFAPYALQVQTLFIEPGSPWENGYVESFNGKLRDELLDREIFYTLTEAKILIERWHRQYNTVRPHSALGYRPPAPAAISPAPLSGMIMSPALS